jgi:hypothetical protein
MSEHQLARAGLAREGLVGLPCDWRGGPRLTPARRLMAAVLEDAVHELAHPGGGSARARERRCDEILAWFASDDDTWPFSFVNVCDALGIAPSRLRTQLRGS